jgi:hypothetical protein
VLPRRNRARFSTAFHFRGGSAGAFTLSPGSFREISQNLNANIVFVGYRAGTGPRDIDINALLSQLPAQYRLLHRQTAFYTENLVNQAVGLRFNFTYRPVYAGTAFENALLRLLDQYRRR